MPSLLKKSSEEGTYHFKLTYEKYDVMLNVTKMNHNEKERNEGMKVKKLLAMVLSLALILQSTTIVTHAFTADQGVYLKGGTVVYADESIYTATRTDLRDESIYYLMITRFYDGDLSNNVHCWDDGQAGNPDSDPAWRGDFKGLIEKLDYIKALGFTAVQLTPVAQNASGYDYHGYHPINLKRIDPRFESEGYTYQDLIEACHARELKVIQEVNFNSTSNFGEEFLCHLFDVDHSKDLSNLEESLIPTKLLLDTYGLGSVQDYWAQPGGAQYQQRLNLIKNVTYTGDNSNSTGKLPASKDYELNKLSSSDVYNSNNYYHSGYFQNPNYDDWTTKFSQIAGDCVDINTENPAVAEYLLECCKMYIDMGVDALFVVQARHIDRLSLNVQYIEQIKDLFRAKGKEPAIYLDVVTRYSNVWYRETATESVPYYTWKESDDKWAEQWNWGTSAEEVNNNMNLIFDHTIEEVDISDEPTSDNALLNGITYHEPDYSMAGANVYDFNMQYNFNTASSAFNYAVDSDKYFNDATWNIVGVDGFDYSTQANDSTRFNGGTLTWAENLCLMFTFRGIPRVLAGTEVEFQKDKLLDKGTLLPLSETGRAYYGDYLEGDINVTGFGEYTASGTVSDTLSSPLADHIQRLNAIRRAVPALRKGQYTTSSDYVSGNMAFIKRYTNAGEGVDSLALVTISGEAEFKNIPNGTYVDAVTGDTKTVTDGTLSVPAPGTANMRVYVCHAPGFTGFYSEFDILETCTLGFDGNGAEGQMDSVSANSLGYVTLPAATFTAPAGKVFKAWEVDGVQYNAGTAVKITSDTTAKAIWRDAEYYGLKLGDTVVSELNKDNILGDGTASYDPDTFTLTLNGYNGRTITTSLGTLNIVLAQNSKNVIKGTDYGIYSNGGSITINGDAGLAISAGITGVFADSITISNANVTAVSYKGIALSNAPVFNGYTKYKAVAGRKADGSDAAEYVSSDNELYKYFKVNSYYTVSFMSEDGNNTLYSFDTESGIIVLPEFLVIGADEGSYEYWSGNGKNYLPGAKLAIDADTEFVPVSGGGGEPVEDNAIYFQNDGGWSRVFAHYWGYSSFTSWPGNQMENIEGTNIWKITDIPSDSDGIIFNSGGNGSQTSDLVIPTDGKNLFSYATREWSEYSPGIKVEDTSGLNIVSFSAGDGTGYMRELLINDGEFKLPDCTMICPEYSNAFTAWSIGGKEYQPGDVVTISEDTIILAVWDFEPEVVISGDGAGGSHTIGSGENITVTGNGKFAKFVCVKVDGNVVDESSYTAKEGSTIITLKAAYLDTLSVGTHTIEIVWTNGFASTTFTINEGIPDAPETGDSTPVGLFLGLLIGSGFVAAGFCKKKRYIVND